MSAVLPKDVQKDDAGFRTPQSAGPLHEQSLAEQPGRIAHLVEDAGREGQPHEGDDLPQVAFLRIEDHDRQ